jgi:hypothetical protein
VLSPAREQTHYHQRALAGALVGVFGSALVSALNRRIISAHSSARIRRRTRQCEPVGELIGALVGALVSAHSFAHSSAHSSARTHWRTHRRTRQRALVGAHSSAILCLRSAARTGGTHDVLSACFDRAISESSASTADCIRLRSTGGSSAWGQIVANQKGSELRATWRYR